MKSTRKKSKHWKALRFRELRALKSSLIVAAEPIFCSLQSTFSLFQSVYLCCKQLLSTINTRAPLQWVRPEPALPLHMPKVLAKLYALITTWYNCYQMQFEYLSPHFTVAALDDGQRGSVRITRQNLISLDWKLCCLVSLCAWHRPPASPIHTT